jgi:hypothetical protein
MWRHRHRHNRIHGAKTIRGDDRRKVQRDHGIQGGNEVDLAVESGECNAGPSVLPHFSAANRFTPGAKPASYPPSSSSAKKETVGWLMSRPSMS